MLRIALCATVQYGLLGYNTNCDQCREVSASARARRTHIYRYLAIAFPMKTMGLSSTARVRKVIVCTWLVSAVLATPAAVKIVG